MAPRSADSPPGIIGGMFGLQPKRPVAGASPAFLRGGELFLVNARSAIATLLQLVGPVRVWMPSYLCECLPQVAARCGQPPRFYELDERLRPASDTWLRELREGDLVVVIEYFGFPTDPDVVAAIRGRGARVLADASQALLTPSVGREADYVVFSPRKHLGVPDGGILAARAAPALPPIDLAPPPDDWSRTALEASTLRREFDLHGGDRRWFDLFRETEAAGPVGQYAMSELSRTLLASAFDYAEIARRRVANYRLLLERLPALALFPELPEGVVPLGFPVRLPERDRVRSALFREEIYPPVHWELRGVVPETFERSHRLARQIMTLPCDQRYGAAEMARMAEIVRGEAGC